MRKQLRRMICFCVASLLMLTGCEKIEQYDETGATIATQTTTTATSTTEVQAATSVQGVQYDEVALDVPEIERQDVSMTLEAEDSAIPESCSVLLIPRLGYSGEGYLSGISANNGTKLDLQVEIPTTQHYDITVVAGSSAACTCKIQANGETVYTLVMDSTENFLRITIQGIFLQAGDCTLTIMPVDGIIDVDCVELTNNTSLYDDDATIADAPTDADASPAAVALYQFLYQQYGTKIITGQYVSSSENTELEEIYATTGKYPLIRFADVGDYTQDDSEATAVEDSLVWAESGGIVGLSWYWIAPLEEADIYTKNTDFSLADAVTELDIATSSDQLLQQLQADGEISEACYAIIHDIDIIAEALQPLADADVAVLWRPLMEASGDWYWWGASGVEAYNWLWNLLYTRLTEYHGLHNLIWVWNGQSDSYLVDEAQYDIASLDLYVEEDGDEAFGSRYEQYVALRNMTSNKILAISECSTVPNINAMFRDNAVWSFFGLWYAPYLEDPYTSEDDLITIYNSEAALTLGDY